MAKILVVDDDPKQHTGMKQLLSLEGHDVETAESGVEALEKIQDSLFDLVLTDMRMPGMNGRELLHALRKYDPNIPVIFITAWATLEDAVQLVRDEGAFSYLDKPISTDNLLEEISKALLIRTGGDEEVHDDGIPQYQFDAIIGQSQPMQRLFRDMSKIITRGVKQVLVTGESGTGKELVARAIHEYGKRSAKSFIPVNCSAIPSDLLENELFGHEKGAYTGADSTKVGRFELADGGTILLDEIGDIPPFFQAKLLRVIQEREIWRVGGVKPIPIDVCVIAATNHDLVEETRNGRFREDLFYRLSVVPLVIPPLREKRDDIEPLVKHFWERYTEEYDAPPKTITPRALSALRRYDWPGNVRQLENLLRSVLVLSDADQVDIEDLPPEITDSSQIPVELSIEIPEEGVSWEEVEKQYILAALQRTGGNQIEAAALLRISRRKLQYRMGKHSIRSQDIR